MVIVIRLGRFETPCSFQLFLGTPCIDMPKKCHSSTQKSKPRPRACLEEASVDQWETRFELADPWLVQTYFFKVSSGPGLWLLWSTMQLFRLIYTGCPQKWLKTTGCPKSTQPNLQIYTQIGIVTNWGHSKLLPWSTGADLTRGMAPAIRERVNWSNLH